MRRLAFPTLALVATSALFACSQEAGLSPEGRAALDGFLGAAVEEGRVPAVEALVVDREGVLYHEAFGTRNAARGEPLRRGDLFDIASMTKPVTSAAAMILIEEGRLSLEDEASAHLPSLRDLEVLATYRSEDTTYTAEPMEEPVTIRHLLTHTSGFGYPWLQEAWQGLAAKHGEPEPFDYTHLPLLHQPGAAWNYGIGPRVLGTVVERASGKGLGEFFAERIFGPLGMEDTFYGIPEEKLDRRVTLHVREAGELAEQPLSETHDPPAIGDASLTSTAQDYGRFVRMLLNGGALDGRRILSEASVEAMTRNQVGDFTVQEVLNGFPPGQGRDGFGYGFRIASDDPGEAPRRAAGSYSWAGAYDTFFWVDPAHGIAAVLLMQTWPFYGEEARAALEGFERRVYEGLR